jgi:hypothetical protein
VGAAIASELAGAAEGGGGDDTLSWLPADFEHADTDAAAAETHKARKAKRDMACMIANLSEIARRCDM